MQHCADIVIGVWSRPQVLCANTLRRLPHSRSLPHCAGRHPWCIPLWGGAQAPHTSRAVRELGEIRSSHVDTLPNRVDGTSVCTFAGRSRATPSRTSPMTSVTVKRAHLPRSQVHDSVGTRGGSALAEDTRGVGGLCGEVTQSGGSKHHETTLR